MKVLVEGAAQTREEHMRAVKMFVWLHENYHLWTSRMREVDPTQALQNINEILRHTWDGWAYNYNWEFDFHHDEDAVFFRMKFL